MGFNFGQVFTDIQNATKKAIETANEVKDDFVALKSKTPEQIGNEFGNKTNNALNKLGDFINNSVEKADMLIKENQTKTLEEIGLNVKGTIKEQAAAAAASIKEKTSVLRERYTDSNSNKLK